MNQMNDVEDFAAGAFMLAASARCGLNYFGDDDFVTALEMFVRSCHEDGYVSADGFAMIRESCIGILVNRLRIEDDIRRHPEILDETLESPLIIIGSGRVGSTKMHRLLAQATNIQSFPFWQLKNPARVPGVAAGQPDPRIAQTVAICVQIETHLPQLFVAIQPDAMEPDEEVHVLDLSFMQFYFCALAYTPSYLDWILQQDWREPYRYFKRTMQYLQWQNGTSGKPVLLKGPFHTIYTDLVYDLLPGAKFVHLHRDPVTCAASLGKVTYLLQALANGTASLVQNGQLLEDYITAKLLKNLRIRDRRPDIPIADFYFEEVREDPLGLAQKIFDFWGVTLTADGRQAMQDWEAQDSQRRFVKFDYNIEETGISRARMEANLLPYMQRFYAHRR